MNTEVKREIVTSSFFPNIPASLAATCISSWLYVIPDFFWAFTHTHTHTHTCVYDAGMFGVFCFYISWIKLTIPPHNFPPSQYILNMFFMTTYVKHAYLLLLYFSLISADNCPCGCDAVDSTTAFPLTPSLRVPVAGPDSGEPGVSGKWRHRTVPETLSTNRMHQPLPAPLSR